MIILTRSGFGGLSNKETGGYDIKIVKNEMASLGLDARAILLIEDTDSPEFIRGMRTRLRARSGIDTVFNKQGIVMDNVQAAYSFLQTNWIETNNLKEGDHVLITSTFESGRGGWDGVWTKEMNNFVGKSFIVGPLNEECWKGIPLVGLTYFFPFYVLEKVNVVFRDVPWSEDMFGIQPLTEFRQVPKKDFDRVLLCVNACRGISDEELKSLLEKGDVLRYE